MKGRRVGQDPVSIHGIIVPEKPARTGKRRRLEEVLQEQGLLDGDNEELKTYPAPEPQVEPAPEPQEIKKTQADEDDVEIIDIPVGDILTSRYQPRLVIDQEKLEALADEIHAAGGLNNPINVLPREDGKFELITGERRWRAHLYLKWPTIKARVRRISDREAQVIALTDNTSGEPLTPFEEALAVRRYLDSGSFTSLNDLAKRMGKHKSTLSRQLSYFKLPGQIVNQLEETPGLLGLVAAVEMAQFTEEHPELVIEAFNQVVAGKMAQNKAGHWLSLQSRKKARTSAGKTRYNRRPTRSIELSSPPDVAVSNVKISGKKITFECQGDPESTLRKMADVLGIHLHLDGSSDLESDGPSDALPDNE